jgi:hypothetical protein
LIPYCNISDVKATLTIFVGQTSNNVGIRLGESIWVQKTSYIFCNPNLGFFNAKNWFEIVYRLNFQEKMDR